MDTETFKAKATALRESLGGIVSSIDEIAVDLSGQNPVDGQNVAEMQANLTIALRSAEDSAMRLGKAIQAALGGRSPLGGPKTPGTV